MPTLVQLSFANTTPSEVSLPDCVCTLVQDSTDTIASPIFRYREFGLDALYDERATTLAVFNDSVRPLLDTALAGGAATFIAFGQTGTGKTYTVNGIHELVAATVFEPTTPPAAPPTAQSTPLMAPSAPPRAQPQPAALEPEGAWAVRGRCVGLQVIEVKGRKCYDLLHGRTLVRLMHGTDGEVHVCGAKSVRAPSSQALLEALDHALASRATAATQRNASSSRSHCIVRMEMLARPANDVDEGGGSSGGGGGGGDIDGGRVGGRVGVLTLVDLAGSERNAETTGHTGAAQRESADINSSLMTLKECFRALTEKDVEQEVVLEKWTVEGERVEQVERAVVETEGGAEVQAEFGGGAGIDGLDDPDGPAGSTVVSRLVVRDKAGGYVRKLRMPFRNHCLATILKDCFTNAQHRTLVCAMVSPAATDTEHTRRTLELVCGMRGKPDEVMRVTR